MHNSFARGRKGRSGQAKANAYFRTILITSGATRRSAFPREREPLERFQAKSPNTCSLFEGGFPCRASLNYCNKGASQAWLYFPLPYCWAALHGLEPGHSKNMMARRFIVGDSGTRKNRPFLAWFRSRRFLTPAVSGSGHVWHVSWAESPNADTTEPYFPALPAPPSYSQSPCVIAVAAPGGRTNMRSSPGG